MAGKGERKTRQKRVVYDALKALDHPTATEVYEEVRRMNDNASRGTVFRLLGSFAASGRVRKVQLSDSDDRYDATVAPHAHARCRTCGRIMDVYLPEVERALSEVKTEGFYGEGYALEFFGKCEICKQKEDAEHAVERQQDGTEPV
ncbi:MAG: Fur family transcriptional regulator [Candidatus Gallimonas sp.]